MGLSAWQLMVALGIGLLVVEALVPGFVFAGFAIGAFALALLFLAVDASPIALDLVVFALASAGGFFLLRRVFRQREDSRRGDGDVNRY